MRKEQKRNLIVTFIIAAVLLAVYVFLVQAEKSRAAMTIQSCIQWRRMPLRLCPIKAAMKT